MEEFRFPYQERKHRLDSGIYIDERIISFTLCIKNRGELFVNTNIFKKFEEILLAELKSFDCSAYVYLFMPNHVHLLLSGNNPRADIKKCLESFKQKTGFWLYKNKRNYKWQKDYYDHILRSEENSIFQMRYILNNPVRASLVEY